MKPKLLDTNILIRFLTADDAKQADAVQALFQEADKGELELPNYILSEIVWVLLAVYKLSKEQVIEKLEGIISFEIFALDRKQVRKAIELYQQEPISFVDAMLVAQGLLENKTVYSFDKRMSVVEGSSVESP